MNIEQPGPLPDPHTFWLTFGDVCRENRRRYPQRTAVVCGAHRFTYVELDDRVTRLADSLRQSGVGVGDRVTWLGQNCHQGLELFLACAKIGAALAPINWRLSAEEMSFQLADIGPKVVVWHDEEIGDGVRAGRALYKGDAIWCQGDDPGPDGYEALLARGARRDVEVPVSPESTAIIIYTAAFGGRPNGAMLHHSGLLTTAVFRAMASDVSDATVYLNATNLYHIGCWDFGTLPTLLMGGNNVFLRRWDAKEGTALVEREKVTMAFMAGPMYQGILDEAAAAGRDISSLRPPKFLHDRVGGYGQSEVHGVQTFRFLGGPAEGTNGRSSPFSALRLVDDAGNEVPDGEVGELVFKGPIVMSGYLNRPELNQRALRNGWRHTNDLGRRLPDGSISFVGVKQRMLKSGAENIYPVEVETAVKSHPKITDCAVIGVPDARWDQNVKAIVVLAAGESMTADDVIDHCKSCLASYKKPKLVEFVAELPRTNGQVDYDALDAAFGGGGYPGLK